MKLFISFSILFFSQHIWLFVLVAFRLGFFNLCIGGAFLFSRIGGHFFSFPRIVFARAGTKAEMSAILDILTFPVKLLFSGFHIFDLSPVKNNCNDNVSPHFKLVSWGRYYFPARHWVRRLPDDVGLAICARRPSKNPRAGRAWRDRFQPSVDLEAMKWTRPDLPRLLAAFPAK